MKQDVTVKRTAHRGIRAGVGALLGVLTAAVALGIAQLMAGFTGSQTSPVLAVASAAVNLTPGPVKDFAVGHFGSNDKNVLIVGILVILFIFALLIGVVALRRLGYGFFGLAVFAAVGALAAATRPGATGSALTPTLVGTAAAVVALTVLVRTARAAFPAVPRTRAAPAAGEGLPPTETAEPTERAEGAATPAGPAAQATEPATADTGDRTGADGAGGDRPVSDSGVQGARKTAGSGTPRLLATDRRRFLAAGAAVAAVAAVGGGVGEALLSGASSTAVARSRIKLPTPATPASSPPAGYQLNGVPGLSSFYTPNSSFYRVDIDLVLPQVSPNQWTLRVHGMVDHPMEITYNQLLHRPLLQNDMTLVCVSNEVGGPYVGNARWLGASLADVLRQAGVQRGADMVYSRAVDGMTISTPIQTIMEQKDAMLAVGMNGQPLPVKHGFPVRMLVPGLYGYVSATKWVTDVEVTTFAKQQAYWTHRGYSQRAPIKTESRIDVPSPLSKVSAGEVAVAGVAWAPTRGISQVQVNVDNGSWHTARLSAADGLDTWRQWVWKWHATAGNHTVQVRAADGAGVVQTSKQVGVVPNGASGWDSVVVTVT